MSKLENIARHLFGLTLALVCWTSVARPMSGPTELEFTLEANPSWNFTGGLNTARYWHTATLLPNGKVLVAGGFTGGTHICLNSGELYDPATQNWSTTGNLNMARFAHTATLLPNGKVLVAGGLNSGSETSFTNSAELYDPATGTWSVTGNLKTERAFHAATLLQNGKVLIAGGTNDTHNFPTDQYSLNSAEIYDPVTGTWSITGNLNIGHDDHTATLLENGRVLVAGDDYSHSAELYDPDTGTCTNTGFLLEARAGHTATLLPDGKVLAAGGWDGFHPLASAELYDSTTGTWSSTATLNKPRSGHTATLLVSGQVLVAGGSYSQHAELYDPTTRSWNSTADLNLARSLHTATLLPSGKVLVAGGFSNDNGTLNSSELYDPGANPILNPIDDSQFFVRQQYSDFLNREPDASGLAFWTGEINLCGSDPACIQNRRVNVSGAFFLSIEFQQTGYLVYRIYKASYGDIPGAPVPVRLGEFLPDTRQIGQGVVVNQTGWEQVLENNKQTFSADFVQRSRFTSAFPISMTPAQFVDTLFANAGVVASSGDRGAAISEFGSASTTTDVAARAKALRRVAENSILEQQESNRAFVLMQYFGYLRRNPNDPPEPTLDFQGYNFWLNKLNSFGGNFANAEMVKAFILSDEYLHRFGP